MSKIKRLAGETALYGLGSIVPRAINFFLIIPHTNVFAPEEYGVITDLYAWVAFLNVVYSFGMETTYFRFASKAQADPVRIFNIAQTTVLIITLSISALFLLFAQPIANGFHIPTHANYVVWLVATMAIDACVAIPFARLRLEKKALKFALAKLVNVVIIASLNVYFLGYAYDPSFGVGYVFLFNLIANAFYLVFFARTLIQWRPVLDKIFFRPMLTYAYPIMITGLAGMTNEMFSRITLRSWLPENFYPGKSASYALGVFGACYKFATFMNLAVQAFRFAAEPFFFSNAADKESPQLFARVNHYFIVVCCIFLLGISINLDLLQYILRDEAFREGLPIVPVLLTGYLFLGIYYNLTVWFKLTDKTYYGTIITGGGAVVTILANYVLIPVAGYMGSSLATLICYLSMTVACYLLGRRYLPIPYQVTRGLAYILITLLLIYGIRSFAIDNLYIATGFHTVVILAFAGIAYQIEKPRRH